MEFVRHFWTLVGILDVSSSTVSIPGINVF
jgi:hypothetical protein